MLQNTHLDSLSRGLKVLKKRGTFNSFSELTVSVSLERYPSRDLYIAKV